MQEPIRTERTFGVTGELRPIQRRNLLALKNSEVWPDLLDVMEMVCIQIETKLINTDAADESAVLANHKMAKAAWQIFTQMQETIAIEAAAYLQSIEKAPPVPELTREEVFIENVLDPTKPAPDGETYQ